jgi:cell division protein FtsZ
MRPKITVIGVGGGGGNAINNMIAEDLQGADFVVANTDAQRLPCPGVTTDPTGSTYHGRPWRGVPARGRPRGSQEIDSRDHGPPCGNTHVFCNRGHGGGTGTVLLPS